MGKKSLTGEFLLTFAEILLVVLAHRAYSASCLTFIPTGGTVMTDERESNQEDLEVTEEEAETVQGGFSVPGAPAVAQPPRAVPADEVEVEEEIRRMRL
jgi:hypothetical protein